MGHDDAKGLRTGMTVRVLVVDDEPDIRLVARAALTKVGCQVIVAGTGLEALARAVQDQPDVILLDCMLPDLDGFDTCARLKAEPATCNIPVVFLTGKTDQAAIERGLALGARGYISKPFNPLTLGRQVQEILRPACSSPAPEEPSL